MVTVLVIGIVMVMVLVLVLAMAMVMVMVMVMVMHGCRSTRDAVPLIEDVSLSTGSEAVAVESDPYQRSE